MDRIDPAPIAQALMAAPVWARRGLTDRDPQMRERAAETIAAIVAAKLREPVPEHDPRQIALL